jgi:hypothetical protein
MVAMAWEKTGIKMWDWGRGVVPESLLVEEDKDRKGRKRIETGDLGIVSTARPLASICSIADHPLSPYSQPTAHFPFEHCSPDHFRNQHIILNIALCVSLAHVIPMILAREQTGSQSSS